MSGVPHSYHEDEQPLNLDGLRLVHARQNLDHVSLDTEGNAVLHNTNKRNRVSNTMHFTLNSVVGNHQYGKFNHCHCVIVAPFKETIDLGNVPEGLLAADTYFHADAQRNVSVATPVMFAPKGLEVPAELEKHVRRYDRGINDQETDLFKARAVREYFKEQNIPFYNVDYDDWDGAEDYKRPRKIQEALGLPEETFRGRHVNSPSEKFERKMRVLYENLGLYGKGVQTVRDHYGNEIPITEKLEMDREGLDKFLKEQESAQDAPNALAFYRKHAAGYEIARRSILAAGPSVPNPPTA